MLRTEEPSQKENKSAEVESFLPISILEAWVWQYLSSQRKGTT